MQNAYRGRKKAGRMHPHIVKVAEVSVLINTNAANAMIQAGYS